MKDQKSKSKIINSKSKIPLTPFKKGGIYGSQITENFGSSLTSDLRPLTSVNGIALVAVLAILVVLAIIAASFTTLMNIELRQSNQVINSFQLDMLVEAGLEHAKTMLVNSDEPSELSEEKFTHWMYVKDKADDLCGRYRLRIEDESAKVNINKAYQLKNGKGKSWDTGEIVLPRALGVSPKIAEKIINFRYGPNKVPGGRGDDDNNNAVLMADGIDNDADGLIDEDDEGINDPSEYTSGHLRGDDRNFTTINEVLSVFLNTKKKLPLSVQESIRREVPRRATVRSIDKSGSRTLQNEKPSDINCVTARECRQRFTTASASVPFQPNSRMRSQLAANMVDYRDENHVLSTLGSTYGVEAICFNEILANDESFTYLLEDGNLNPGNDYAYWGGSWEKQYGTTDDKRSIYHISQPYFAVPDDNFYMFDPREAWRIKYDEGIRVSGKLNASAGSMTITLPDVPGKKGTGKAEMTNYRDGVWPSQSPPWKNPEGIPGNRSWCYWDGITVTTRSRNDYTDYYNELMGVLKKRGQADGNHPDLPPNFFKNAQVMIYTWGYSSESGSTKGRVVGCFDVTSSKGHKITAKTSDANSSSVNFATQLAKYGMTPNNCDLSICFVGWGNRSTAAHLPKVNSWSMIRSRQPIGGRYFKVVIDRQPVGRWFGYKTKKLGVSGTIGGKFSEDKDNSKQWPYKDGKAIKTDKNGWIDLMLTSSPDVSRQSNLRQTLWYVRMIAPEVAEMFNASATPVSLANWRVICNTGSLATEIGRIKRTSYYDRTLRRPIVDDNPVVSPGGHFYLVNDTELFDYWYGNGDGNYGSAPKEEVPVFQMGVGRWGITYEVESAKFEYPPARASIRLKGETFDKADKLFEFETVMFIDEKGKDDPQSWHGIFAPVLSELIEFNNEIAIAPTYSDWAGYMDPGTKVMVLGLPHKGGIVSLTLKNEYEQICARTVDYGKVEPEDLGQSTEKVDPTKNTWVKREQASIAGRNKDALNRAMQSRQNEKFFIKNGHYGSICELRYLTTGDDFERLGSSGNMSKSVEAISAIGDVMCASHVRLESCAGNVVHKGWKEAADEVESSSLRSVACKNGRWEKDQWKGQTLRFLTGKLRGEKFPIIGNTKKVILLADTQAEFVPRSAPNRKVLKPGKGDRFSLGPGYSSAMCFTRLGNKAGEWTWENAIQIPGKYDLYIHGLNDAIDTTEFLEENNNASIDVAVWNYKTKQFDTLCKKKKYNKHDSFNAGKILHEHVSNAGDFRLQLVAHEVVEKEKEAGSQNGDAIIHTGGRQTGMAWFNYAVVTPVPVIGRVNINTAPARLLASLPGISSELAKNIEKGTDSSGKPMLKPYKRLGDLFKVKEMTLDIFERCVNLLMLDSSTFTVEVEAQTLKATRSGELKSKQVWDEFAPDIVNNIIATRTKRFVLELEESKDGFSGVRELERY